MAAGPGPSLTIRPTLNPPVDFFRDTRWTAGVMGLGYVGLPLALTACRAGLPTVGFDISADRVETLRQGRSHVDDVTDRDLADALGAGCVITADPQELKQADAILVCVPSPLGRNREPDLSYIESATETVAEVARKGQLVALESTSYPGTTEDYVVPAVEAAGLRLDEDVYVAFSPERLSPGDRPGMSEIPKVVGGVTQLSGEVAEAAYRRLVPQVYRVSSARAAEMTKLLENTFRAVNIALVNELTMLCDRMDIDIWEVIDAAATKPYGFLPFYPGPGVGGHCIPVDPYYLSWKAREFDFHTKFIELAAERAQRHALVEAEMEIAGRKVHVRHSQLDMGSLAALLDGDPRSLLRTMQVNPFVKYRGFEVFGVLEQADAVEQARRERRVQQPVLSGAGTPVPRDGETGRGRGPPVIVPQGEA